MARLRSWVSVVAAFTPITTAWSAEPVGAPTAAVKIEGDFRAIRSDYPLPLPFAIRSQEDASNRFEGAALRNLLAKVDFATHYALVFAWDGSRYDELTASNDLSNHLGVSFLLEKAMTADVAEHVEVYALRSNVRYGFSKSLEDATVGKSQLTSDAPWMPDGSGVEPEPEPDRVVYRLMRDGKRGGFVPDGRLELRTKAEALRYFSEIELAEVDFQKQYILVLSWGGSGGDEIRATYDKADPKEIVFTITEGMTMDYCPHFRAYAIQSGARWCLRK